MLELLNHYVLILGSTLRKLKLLSRVCAQLDDELKTLKPSGSAIIEGSVRPQLKQVLHRIRNHRYRLSEELTNYIQDCTAAQRKTMYSNMQEWLSRDLRDMIYEFVFKDSHVHVHQRDLKSGRYPENARFVPQTFLSHTIDASGFEMFSDIHCTDEVTRQELTEAWYTYTCFRFNSNALVPKFFAPERWHPTTQPYSLVCRIECYWHGESWYRCRTQLLLGFRPKTQVTLVADRQQPPGSQPFENDGEETVITKDFGSSEGMNSALAKLLDAGYRVIYRFDSHISWDMIPSNPTPTV